MGVRVPPLATLAGRSNVKVQLEELSPIVRRLTVELPPVRVDEALADAYRSLGRTVKIRGFRPGKAPRRILEELYKDQVERDVSTRLVEGSLAGALAEKAIAAVATPVIEQDRLMQGQPYRYRALIEVMPKIEPKDYRGLSLVAKGAAAGDDAVEAELARIRESLATLDPVLRAGDLCFDPSTRELRRHGELLSLTATELAILELLLRRRPSVVARRTLAANVWDDEVDAVGSNTIDVHMARLRAKLAGSTARVHTVRGVGYRIIEDLPPPPAAPHGVDPDAT